MSISAATELQHRASNPAEHVWVSASAGSGKTTVLVNRLLRLLMGDGLPAPAAPHRILCLTYTKAAAAEMQLRLEAQLITWATTEAKNLDAQLEKLTGRTPDEDMRCRARALFAELGDSSATLRIQTIHSFCQSVLARFPVEAGISPGFTALDDIEANALLNRAMNKVWQQTNGGAWKKSKSWLQQRYRAAKQLQGLVPNLLRNWPEMAAIIPDETAEDIYWHDTFAVLDTRETEKEFWEFLLSDAELPLSALRAWAGKNKKQGHAIFDFIVATPGARADMHEFYWDLFFRDSGDPRTSLPDDLADEPQRLLKIKDQRLAAASAAMGILIARVGREYQNIKDDLGALDFADMIRRTRELLSSSDMAAWVHYKLDGGIDHILLDEAQDTAPEQWQVIHALAQEFFVGQGAAGADRPRSLFVVGDPKQSIYSFQGADSSLFRAVELDLSARADAAETALRAVPLTYSFRTAPNLLAWVDETFSGDKKTIALHGHAETIQHNAIHQSRIGAARIYPAVPAVKNEKSGDLLADADETDRTHNTRVAEQIADTVSGWLRAGRMISGGANAIQPRDILILLQQRTTIADALQSALTSAGVPVMGSDRLRLTDAPAVQDIFALCKFLLFPQDDLNLANALRSPFINLPENTLEKISSARGDQSLWQAINTNTECAHITDYLKDLLTHTDRETAYETLARIVFMPCPTADSGMQALHARLGTPADDPAHELLTLAQHEGEANQPLSLGAFIDWVLDANIQIKREMAQQNQNVVRILTVHGAKGLEAPIVILADAADVPHAHGSKQDKAIPYEGSTPHFLFAPGKAEEGPAFDRSENRSAKSDEHQRLLYVAMTRASHELHVFGKATSKGETRADSWYAQLSSSLTNLGAADTNGILHYGTEDEFTADTRAENISGRTENFMPQKLPAPTIKQPMAITEWINRHSPRAVYAGNTSPLAARRGTVIHRLLELLPGMENPERAEKFLARELPELTRADHLQIIQQVLAVIHSPETQMFFTPAARAEVPIAGEWQGTPVYGKIDRMYAHETELGILDFKTGQPPADGKIPPAYALQIRIYAGLLSKIYPNHTIKSGVLWVNNLEIAWDSMINAAAA